MYQNEIMVQEHHKDLMREADQRRLARQVGEQGISLIQRMGQSFLKFGAHFAVLDASEYLTVENRAGQVVTVCPA